MRAVEYIRKHYDRWDRKKLFEKCIKATGCSYKTCENNMAIVRRERMDGVPEIPGRKSDPQNLKEREIKELEKKLAIAHKKIQHLVSAGKRKVDVLDRDVDKYKFALVSDLHFGSLYHDDSALEAFLKYAKSAGVQDVYNAGDNLSGHKVYSGHEFEVKSIGFDKQIKEFEEFPWPKGLNYFFIDGNHDESFKKQNGIVVGDEIALRLEDWNYLGYPDGSIEVKMPNGTFKIMLIHPDGGTTYAISYRTQQIINGLEGGKKPHVLGVGHLHKADLLPAYRNVAGIQCGAFEKQTPFLKRKGSPSMVGGWIIEFSMEKGLNRIKTEFCNFY